jgi:hypothetical protein
MPSKSEAQRKFLFWKFGAGWMKRHHFDNPGKLPEHVSKAKNALGSHIDFETGKVSNVEDNYKCQEKEVGHQTLINQNG